MRALPENQGALPGRIPLADEPSETDTGSASRNREHAREQRLLHGYHGADRGCHSGAEFVQQAAPCEPHEKLRRPEHTRGQRRGDRRTPRHFAENDEITDKELGEMIKEIRDYITFTNFGVINYVQISEKKELAIIIKDKYKLFGIQVSKDNFQEDSIEDFMKKVAIITDYNNILKSEFSIENLQYIMTVKGMLKK